jgi:RNAse (barnase) inhibitor barstar
MVKFLVCLIGWVLLPIAIVVVGFEVAKCWVEEKL